MFTYRYSRWDGTQKEFSLDVDRALDAMSELMMEGLSAREALEWMQRMGFELAGMNMRVMGLDEIQHEIRESLRDLYNRFDLDEALPEMQQRLDEILDREQQALQREHGFESSAMNDFLARRYRERRRTSEQIEDFREHAFQDEQAARDFAELLDELDAMQQLEEFMQQRGERFRGEEMADYEQAQQIREQIERRDVFDATRLLAACTPTTPPIVMTEISAPQKIPAWRVSAQVRFPIAAMMTTPVRTTVVIQKDKPV